MDDDDSEIFAESDDDTRLEIDTFVGGSVRGSGRSLSNQPSNSGD